MEFVLAALGFVLFFCYDVDSVRPVRPWFHHLFAAGCGMQAAATAFLLWKGWSGIEWGGGAAGWCVGAGVFLLLLIYTLFFALPFEATYVEKSGPRMAYTEGVYALCRHPGVLWFIGLYFCLAMLLATNTAALFCLWVSLWDLAYIFLQDLWIFPQTFVNYREYQAGTPFLLPTPKSIGRCARTLGRKGKET